MSDTSMGEMEPSDDAIMEAISRGDGGALATLVSRHGPRLYRFVTEMLPFPDEVDDVVQETFVRVWEHRERWIPGGAPRAYVFRIARNLVLARARHNHIRAKSDGEIRLRAVRARTPLEDTAFAELREALAEAVGKLPDRRREAYLLVRVHQLSLDEAAAIMELTKRTVSNHVYMATSDLEQRLRPFLGGTEG